LTPEQQEYVTAIQSSGDALLTLINDILDFSKIEAGQLSLEVRPLDLRQVVTEVMAFSTAQGRVKGLQISAHVDPAVPPVLLGDSTRLRQVLTNLVANAVKFTEQGAVEVRVDVVEESAEGTLLRISVRDTGVGIAPEVQPRLFEPFTQADASTTRRYGGTGLGLAIVKRLVELMGGAIGVQSTPGAGSTFWLTLRLAHGVAGPGTPTAPAQVVPALPRERERGVGRRPSGRILVAEDNPINQLVAVRLLQSLGCAVETVETGQQAVEAVRQGHYDLVLMDCHMPALDGFAATEAIRRHEQEAGQGHHTPIVALTADALAGDVPKSLAAGMDDHLAKPVTLERLAAVVARWAPAGGAGRSDVALDPSVIAALREMEQGQPGLLARMVGLYLRDARTQLAALRQAAERGDAHELEEAAHSLKGSSAQLGATAMVALCRDLETAAQAADSSRAAALVATLERTFEQVRAALAALPEAAGPGPVSGTDA
jgi:CheY-like chemotaxis protein